jgi:NMD protein affecting ribosome stability and mRNA decay
MAYGKTWRRCPCGAEFRSLRAKVCYSCMHKRTLYRRNTRLGKKLRNVSRPYLKLEK